MKKPKPVAFTRCDNGRDALEDVTPTMRCGSNHSAHLAAAIPINGMTLNKELRDKQMTGAGQKGEPMFAVRSNGAQHAVAHAFYSTGGSHGLESQEELSPPIKVGSALGIPSPPAVVTGCLTPELPQRVRIHGTGGTSPTLSSEHGRGHGVPSVLAPTDAVQVQWASGGGSLENPTAQALRSGAEHNYQFARVGMAVRRLTPRECERLQGFPDDHTLIPWRGKPAEQCPDGPRYKALGNSMAVPCMAWIGSRIAAQEAQPLRYLSVCSGIEAASMAWEPLGWQPAAFAEVEKFPSAVLAHHWPQVPNLGDMTRYESWDLGAIDLLVGGTPCQSFSVAGLRKGLHDPRGGLMLTYLEIARRFGPRWLVWENVPGVLSSHGGRDFGAFLGALGALGYGWAYRVLDAQWFGVAQRRRRVFVIANLGDGAAAAKVLFERESVRRNPAPSREAGERTAAFTPSSIGSYRQGYGTLRANGGDNGGGSEVLVAGANQQGCDLYNCSITGDVAMTLKRADGNPAINLVTVVGALTDGAHNGGA